MKKLLFILLCLPMIFNSCQEDDPTPSAAPPSSPPSSALCGSATFTANGTNYTLNNPHMMVPGECMLMSQVQETNGDYSSVQVSMTNMYSNDWEIEWTLDLVFQPIIFPGAPDLNIGTPVTSGFYVNFSLDPSSPDAEIYTSLSAPNGEMTITSIDPTTNTIDGNFSVTVHPLGVSTMPSLLLNGSFSDIPLLP